MARIDFPEYIKFSTEYLTYRFVSRIGRTFILRRKLSEKTFTLEELRPIAYKHKAPSEEWQPFLACIHTLSPNKFFAAMPVGVSLQDFEIATPDPRVTPKIVDSFKQAKLEINRALLGDYWYTNYEPNAQIPPDHSSSSREDLLKEMSYYQGLLDTLKWKPRGHSSRFTGMADQLGVFPIYKRHLLLSYFNNPSPETWSQLSNVNIVAGTYSAETIWRAYEIHQTNEKNGVPDPYEFEQALYLFIETQHFKALRRMWVLEHALESLESTETDLA